MSDILIISETKLPSLSLQLIPAFAHPPPSLYTDVCMGNSSLASADITGLFSFTVNTAAAAVCVNDNDDDASA